MFDTNAIRAEFEELRELGFAAIPALANIFTAGAVGDPFNHSVRGFKIINTTNQGLKISYNGIIVQDYAPADSAYVWDVATNRIDPAGNFGVERFTQVYVSYDGVAPTSGNFYVVVMYGAVN